MKRRENERVGEFRPGESFLKVGACAFLLFSSMNNMSKSSGIFHNIISHDTL